MDYIKLLSNYTNELHLENLYSTFQEIPFKIIPIKNINWEDEVWLTTNQLPYVSLTHLLDSYSCLPERPDMAFTYIWKAINNNYVQLGKSGKISEILFNEANGITPTPQVQQKLNKLTDSEGINYLKEHILSKSNNLILNTITIKRLLNKTPIYLIVPISLTSKNEKSSVTITELFHFESFSIDMLSKIFK